MARGIYGIILIGKVLIFYSFSMLFNVPSAKCMVCGVEMLHLLNLCWYLDHKTRLAKIQE